MRPFATEDVTLSNLCRILLKSISSYKYIRDIFDTFVFANCPRIIQSNICKLFDDISFCFSASIIFAGPNFSSSTSLNEAFS